MDNLRNYFFDPTEKERAVLGERYLSEFVKTGYSTKTYSILTDKRLYISGKNFSSDNGYIIPNFDNLSLRLDAVHSIEKAKKPIFLYRLLMILTICVSLFFLPNLIYYIYSFNRHYGTGRASEALLYIGMIFVIPIAAICLYKFRRRELIIIKYEESSVGIPSVYYEKMEIQTFIEEIKLAKDEFKFETVNHNTPERDYNSIADELVKYKDMFDKGLIDEEEYRILKSRLIQLPSVLTRS